MKSFSLKRRFRKIAALAGASCVFLTLSIGANAANAAEWDSFKADDANHDFYLGSSLSTNQKNGITWAMANLDKQTDMYDTRTSTLWAGTDINAYAVNQSSGPNAGDYAWAFCNKNNSAGRCDRAHIVFNNHNPHSNLQSLACHEIGHTIGAGHMTGSNSSYAAANRTCMRGNPDVTQYSTSLVSRINSTY